MDISQQIDTIKWTEWYCYLLLSTDLKRTYIGATNNPQRRLRQHNRQQAGGAKATAGREWTRILLVAGFPDSKAALQFEWAWKHHSRKYGSGLQNRLKGLTLLLQQEKSTSIAVPFADWMTPPYIIPEEEHKTLVEQLKLPIQ